MVGIGLPMAMGGGVLYALAANAVSYYADRSKTTGVELTKRQQLALDLSAFCIFVVGGLLATAAYAMGDPVPLLQGALVATNLMLNMAFQIYLGISLYTKPMRIGTLLIFFVVLFQLAEVGPDPRGDDVDVIAMFSQTKAMAWLATTGGLIIVSFIGVRATQSQPSESFAKVFMWSLHLGALGSATDNAASTFGIMSKWVFIAAFTTYGLVSVYVLGMSAKAPAVCDASTFVPLQLSLQLVLNMVTGIFVWEDLDRMDGRSVQSYFVTFGVIVLSVYVASPSADLVDSINRWRVIRGTNLSNEEAPSPFGQSVLVLMENWRNLQMTPGTQSEDAARDALKQALSIGATCGRITTQELVDLAVGLYGSSGTFAPSADFMMWLDKQAHWNAYAKHDPSFRTKLIEMLPESERRKLPGTFVPGGASSHMDMQLSQALSSFQA